MADNLIQHRGAPSVWQRRVRIADGARPLAAIAAIACFASALRRRSAAGLFLAAGAAALGWWALAGRARLVRSRVIPWPAQRRWQRAQEMIDEASEESFPASDPPAWNNGPDV